jgi:dimethylsulfoniopropionate demethylase
VARTGWSKQGGFEIYLDESALGGELWDALWIAGEDLDVGPGAPNLIERIEGGLLSYGGDMTRANNPYECGFDAFCQLDRAIDFIGREALEPIAATGPDRRVRGLRIDADALPMCREPWPVVCDGVHVGQVTSVAMSPRLGCGVAIGMIDAGYWDAGTSVMVTAPTGEFGAVVGELGELMARTPASSRAAARQQQQ